MADYLHSIRNKNQRLILLVNANWQQKQEVTHRHGCLIGGGGDRIVFLPPL